MGKLSIFLFVLFLFVISLFSFANHGVVTVAIPFGPVYEVQKLALILFSMAIGVFVSFIFFAIRDTKKFIDNWQYQKTQKQEIKVQDLYSRALNSLLAKNEDAAREALEDILKEEPDHVDTLLRLGDIAAAADDFQKANARYQRAREIEPKRIETLFALDSLLEKSGRWSEALRGIYRVKRVPRNRNEDGREASPLSAGTPCTNRDFTKHRPGPSRKAGEMG